MYIFLYILLVIAPPPTYDRVTGHIKLVTSLTNRERLVSNTYKSEPIRDDLWLPPTGLPNR